MEISALTFFAFGTKFAKITLKEFGLKVKMWQLF